MQTPAQIADTIRQHTAANFAFVDAVGSILLYRSEQDSIEDSGQQALARIEAGDASTGVDACILAGIDFESN